MVFENSNSDGFVMALVPANRRVDTDKLNEVAPEKLELGSPEKVKKRANCEVGTVPPFGFEEPLKTYMDRKIMENESVNFSAGLHRKSIKMGPKSSKIL